MNNAMSLHSYPNSLSELSVRGTAGVRSAAGLLSVMFNVLHGARLIGFGAKRCISSNVRVNPGNFK